MHARLCMNPCMHGAYTVRSLSTFTLRSCVVSHYKSIDNTSPSFMRAINTVHHRNTPPPLPPSPPPPQASISYLHAPIQQDLFFPPSHLPPYLTIWIAFRCSVQSCCFAITKSSLIFISLQPQEPGLIRNQAPGFEETIAEGTLILASQKWTPGKSR